MCNRYLLLKLYNDCQQTINIFVYPGSACNSNRTKHNISSLDLHNVQIGYLIQRYSINGFLMRKHMERTTVCEYYYYSFKKRIFQC